MVLILTFSEDHTCDGLIPLLDGMPVFRFNIDLWQHYCWEVTATSYRITDPTGRICEESEVRAVYLRKLIFNPPYIDVPAGGNEEAWSRDELLQFVYGLRDLALANGRLALVKPARAASKVRQMRLASRWFSILDWHAFHGQSSVNPEGRYVVKTFAANPLGDGSHLFVQEVQPKALSPDWPWFIQASGDASHDVTVVYVRGRLFAFELTRDFAGVDCRVPTAKNEGTWNACEPRDFEADGMRGIMSELGLDFGRFDFLRIQGQLWFLEINPNGQWGWLDPEQGNGLYLAIANEIRDVWEGKGTG